MVKEIDEGIGEYDDVFRKIDLEGKKKDVGRITVVLLIINLAIMFILLMVGLLSSLRLVEGKVPSTVCIIAVFLLLITLIYYPIAYQHAVQKNSFGEAYDVFDNYPNEIMDELIDSGKLGPSYFLVCISLVVLIVATFLFRGVIKRDDKRKNIQQEH